MKIKVFVIGEIVKSVHAFLDGYEYTFRIDKFPKKKYPISIIKKKGYKFEKEKNRKGNTRENKKT